jgi:hypothetical protein
MGNGQEARNHESVVFYGSVKDEIYVPHIRNEKKAAAVL